MRGGLPALCESLRSIARGEVAESAGANTSSAEQPVELAADNAVAFARDVLETFAIANREPIAPILDQSCRLQLTKNHRDPCVPPLALEGRHYTAVPVQRSAPNLIAARERSGIILAGLMQERASRWNFPSAGRDARSLRKKPPLRGVSA